MARSPRLKVYDFDGEYVASFKYAEDAAQFVALKLDGTTIRDGHRVCDTVWKEGKDGYASEDFHKAARVILRRVGQGVLR